MATEISIHGVLLLPVDMIWRRERNCAPSNATTFLCKLRCHDYRAGGSQSTPSDSKNPSPRTLWTAAQRSASPVMGVHTSSQDPVRGNRIQIQVISIYDDDVVTDVLQYSSMISSALVRVHYNLHHALHGLIMWSLLSSNFMFFVLRCWNLPSCDQVFAVCVDCSIRHFLLINVVCLCTVVSIWGVQRVTATSKYFTEGKPPEGRHDVNNRIVASFGIITTSEAMPLTAVLKPFGHEYVGSGFMRKGQGIPIHSCINNDQGKYTDLWQHYSKLMARY